MCVCDFFINFCYNNETHNNKSNFSIVVSCFSGIDPNLNFEVRYTADVGGRRKGGGNGNKRGLFAGGVLRFFRADSNEDDRAFIRGDCFGDS